MKDYIIVLAQIHPTFRVAELDALADLNNIKIDLSGHDENSPFLIVQLQNDLEAEKLIERTILSKAIYELWGQGTTEEELHKDVIVKSESKFETYHKSSFKFDIVGYHGSKTNDEKIKMIERFGYVKFDGKIKMKNPDEIFTVLEHYKEPITTQSDSPSSSSSTPSSASSTPFQYYFGRQIALSARSKGVLEKYDLKKRGYIGTTTFEAELSLVSCNLAQVDKFKIMYDPFAGTGSFLVAGSKFGAITIGSDIDGRLIKGKGKNSIKGNFKQYNTSLLFLDVCTMDFTHNALRSSMKIDSIVCDPPYGIREGLKVLGAKNPERFKGREELEIDGEKAFLRRDYIPTKKPYSLDNLLYDLLQFASERLPIGGRLAFWMPTANDNFVPTLIPQHRNLELKYHLVQEFNKWSRRLLVYVNHGDDYKGEDNRAATSLPEFREKYFRANRHTKKTTNTEKTNEETVNTNEE